MIAATTVRAVNDLTARWAHRTVGERGTALTATGLWPLLALLATPAAGPAREELAAATGTDAGDAVREGAGLLTALAATDGVDAALGLWTRRALTLRPDWVAALPPAVHGELTGDAPTDRKALNAWVRRHTDGLIERMPVAADPATLLVLASALLVRTTWREPFRDVPLRPAEGPWAGREMTGLRRSGGDPEEIRVHRTPAGELTVAQVAGDNALDVQLLLGPSRMSGGEVLRHGVAALGGAYPVRSGTALSDGAGPGVRVSTVASWDGRPQAELCCAAFTVDAEHDLLEHAGLFGLATATDASRGHFPGISDRPLAVSAARQTVTATFGALGFRAAAVTAIGMRAGSALRPEKTSQVVSATFDRPFGFLARHRESGLVLVAGWVTDPGT
ncbi:serpin family protein [Streptomyces natalensis]|uniref:Aromatic ring-opening dioxygenase LigA n=1 Tax=Streptomyces natalensis ATCC 27448 TaxID=1240678 RepID=A0A0D7CGW1_9ACTN|nr:serpin family protein [Streptomyces natalensis]KIZ15110.1 aromatic ring-opening dioxygenase LigA [Streptomyces natalensis ATCC 27448]